ncbi:hypothetical protein JKI95_11290 [Corynebacterium aquatimens]|nr:hypothetical protein JKI95_11290 [Corynebacterium aquatimens]
MLEAIRRGGGAARVNDIARAVDAHANTVRGHLDALMDAGVIRAETHQSPGRGRPWMLYCLRLPRPAELASEYVGLVEVLASEIGHGTAEADIDAAHRAETLGREWARRAKLGGITPENPGIAGERVPWIEADDPIGAALWDLRRLGFDPYDRGDATIGLRACPFVRPDGTPPNSVICHIHAGYIRERAGRGSVELSPFDRHGECGINLYAGDEEKGKSWTS